MSFEFLNWLLFGGLIVFAALGLPLVFCLGGVAVIFLLLVWDPPYYQAIYWDMQQVLGSFSFLAIPLFIFMANMLERSGIAEDLYTMIHRWIGRLAGGLAMGTVLICTLLAAMVGLSGAAVVTMGVTALPSMLKRGYDKHIAIGSIAAGGTLGILIPPSVIMVVYAIAAEQSIARLFLAGILPGLLLSSVFIAYIAIRCRLQPGLAPPLPPKERASWKEKFTSLRSVILPVSLVALVLGSIFMGIATVTESAAVGATGAILCAVILRRFSWQKFKETNYETLKLTCMIMWILIAALSFTRAYVIIGVLQFFQEVFMGLPLGPWGAIIIIQLTLLLLGCFLDPFGILMITMPIFIPVITSLGFDPVWFGIIFVVNMEMAYLTPPVGLNLFYMKGVVPKGTTMGDIYRSIVPFVLLQGLVLALLMIFPQITLWLPNLLMGSQ